MSHLCWESLILYSSGYTRTYIIYIERGYYKCYMYQEVGIFWLSKSCIAKAAVAILMWKEAGWLVRIGESSLLTTLKNEE